MSTEYKVPEYVKALIAEKERKKKRKAQKAKQAEEDGQILQVLVDLINASPDFFKELWEAVAAQA
jgi:hypothetical protein